MEPSRSKMRRSFADSITDSRPTIRRSCSETDSGSTVEHLETTRGRAREGGRLGGLRADDQQFQPGPDLIVGGHAVVAFEYCFLDAGVGRDLDREPDRKSVRRRRVVRLVDLAVDR